MKSEKGWDAARQMQELLEEALTLREVRSGRSRWNKKRAALFCGDREIAHEEMRDGRMGVDIRLGVRHISRSRDLIGAMGGIARRDWVWIEGARIAKARFVEWISLASQN